MSNLSQTMINTVSKVLLDMHIDQDRLKTLATGGIETSFEEVATAEEAMALFLAFGGEGWLCTAESREIHTLQSGSPWSPEFRRKPWPLWGELVNGENSLHLRRTSDGWSLITLTSNKVKEGIVLETSFLARGDRRMRYLVAYRMQTLNNIEELRPETCRFLGFAQ